MRPSGASLNEALSDGDTDATAVAAVGQVSVNAISSLVCLCQNWLV